MSIPEGLQYQKNYEINSFLVDPSGKLRIKGLFDLLQEIAWRHADSQDFGRNLAASNQMWVLSRMEVKVIEMPSWGQEVRLATGGRGVDRIFAFREFLMQDISGKVLVRGMSSWLLLDTESKRMLKPESVLPQELFDTSMKPEWQPEKLLVKGRLKATETVIVRASDLDLYNHVNNASYVRWVEDLIEGETADISSLTLNYISECHKGDQVKLELYESETCFFVLGKVGDRNCFSARV